MALTCRDAQVQIWRSLGSTASEIEQNLRDAAPRGLPPLGTTSPDLHTICNVASSGEEVWGWEAVVQS